MKQVAIADRLILSKGDLVASHSDPADFAALRARLHKINPRASMHDAVKGQIDTEILRCGTDTAAETAFHDFSDWIAATQDHCSAHDCHDPGHDHGHPDAHAHQHPHETGGITSFVIRLNKAVDQSAFNQFLHEIAIEFGDRLLRMKGILHVAGRPGNPAVIHGVQHVMFPVSWLDHWPDDERATRLVFITQGLDSKRIRDRFDARFA